jgi:hypothetical protein
MSLGVTSTVPFVASSLHYQIQLGIRLFSMSRLAVKDRSQIFFGPSGGAYISHEEHYPILLKFERDSYRLGTLVESYAKR